MATVGDGEGWASRGTQSQPPDVMLRLSTLEKSRSSCCTDKGLVFDFWDCVQFAIKRSWLILSSHSALRHLHFLKESEGWGYADLTEQGAIRHKGLPLTFQMLFLPLEAKSNGVRHCTPNLSGYCCQSSKRAVGDIEPRSRIKAVLHFVYTGVYCTDLTMIAAECPLHIGAIE